jgi:hypothetical protein
VRSPDPEDRAEIARSGGDLKLAITETEAIVTSTVAARACTASLRGRGTHAS